jgi:hypothetical protein
MNVEGERYNFWSERKNTELKSIDEHWGYQIISESPVVFKDDTVWGWKVENSVVAFKSMTVTWKLFSIRLNKVFVNKFYLMPGKLLARKRSDIYW